MVRPPASEAEQQVANFAAFASIGEQAQALLDTLAMQQPASLK